jgi:hypothetical protein
MNTPFKGQIDWLPDFIGEELMKQQEYQGNKRDISVFEEDVIAGKNEGGFEWKDTSQNYNFWDRVLLKKDINLFLAWFTPELEVWDDENEKHLEQVIGYNENEKYPFFIKKEGYTGFAYKHAQLPKKENKAKAELLKKVEELTKQANELLTKAAELKAAAEKI